jgi:L,D-transpeptidase ErfK/SrfK
MWLPGAGTDIMLPGRRILPPGPREGIVVNLPEHRLYYYPKAKKGENQVVITYPVSIGKMDWKTPIGETHVIQKEKHPNWYPPEGVRKEHLANGDPLPAVVKAGPDNPLGDYAMRLAAGNGTYLIHGTNNPMAVGMAITHGCVRMYPEDVAALFPLIPVGTKVWLINEPVKVAFVDGELLMEAHPPVDEEGQNTAEPDLDLLSQKLDQALGSTTAAIHWDFAKEALQRRLRLLQRRLRSRQRLSRTPLLQHRQQLKRLRLPRHQPPRRHRLSLKERRSAEGARLAKSLPQRPQGRKQLQQGRGPRQNRYCSRGKRHPRQQFLRPE